MGSGFKVNFKDLRKIIAVTWRYVFNTRVLAIVLAMIAFAVISGPFGTLTYLGVIDRVLLWGPVIIFGVFAAWIANVMVRLLAWDRNWYGAHISAIIITTLLVSPFVCLILWLISPDALDRFGGLPKIVFFVVCMVALARTIRSLLKYTWSEAGLDIPQPRTDPRIFQRLSAVYQVPILRLSAKDHMVEVVTQAGTEELRLRLGDAVAEMDPVEGLMAHRSHWVAKKAVREAQRVGSDKVFLKLHNGDLVPVSRTFRPDWIEAGILEKA